MLATKDHSVKNCHLLGAARADAYEVSVRLACLLALGLVACTTDVHPTAPVATARPIAPATPRATAPPPPLPPEPDPAVVVAEQTKDGTPFGSAIDSVSATRPWKVPVERGRCYWVLVVTDDGPLPGPGLSVAIATAHQFVSRSGRSLTRRVSTAGVCSAVNAPLQIDVETRDRPWRAQLYRRTMSPQELARLDSDLDVQSCTECMQSRLLCQERGPDAVSLPRGQTCEGAFQSCVAASTTKNCRP